jgi:hypothetical protein
MGSKRSERIWGLRHNVAIYDGWYVALAEALNVPLATLDARLAMIVHWIPTLASKDVHLRPNFSAHVRCPASDIAASPRREWLWRNRVVKHEFVCLRAAHGVRPFQIGKRGGL